MTRFLKQKTHCILLHYNFWFKNNQLHKEPSHLEFEKLLKSDRLFHFPKHSNDLEGFMNLIFLITKIGGYF